MPDDGDSPAGAVKAAIGVQIYWPSKRESIYLLAAAIVPGTQAVYLEP